MLGCGISYGVFGFFSIPAQGAVLQSGATNFRNDTGSITFSEFPQNTPNPLYTPQKYGGLSTGPTVSFGGFFQGQSLGNAQTCPAGVALTACVQGDPTGNLTLDANSPQVSITKDLSTLFSGDFRLAVLSGAPQFNGAISILFSQNVAAAGLTGGYFDAVGSTALTAFGRDGSRLGSVSNTARGMNFLGVVSGDGSNAIAGLQISLIAPEPAGFANNNLRFVQINQIDSPSPTPTPLPTATNFPSSDNISPPPVDISDLPDDRDIPSVPASTMDWGLILGLGVLVSVGQFWKRKIGARN